MARTNFENTDILQVFSVDAGSAAAKSGMKKGDRVISVNGRAVSDEFDFRFHTACDVCRVAVWRSGVCRELMLRRPDNAVSGIHFVQRDVKRCANHCVFCFIDQMPPGLRKSLYIKDEDIGHSFTNGNYVTLSAVPLYELERVASLGLSPLFISVHATDNEVRRGMLGNRCAFDIMDHLRFLARNGISFHTQIVVCPGYNDGTVLRATIKDLLSLKKCLLSVAIVPVGLTKFRKRHLEPVTAMEARTLISYIHRAGENDKQKHGRRRLFCADELFVRAGLPVPQRSYYEDYPQIENGVGLVRQLLEEWKKVKRGKLSQSRVPSSAQKRNAADPKRVLIVTSESASVFLRRIASDVNKLRSASEVHVCPVKNDFFGDLVTVAGLCTGRDIIRAVQNCTGHWDRVIVPRVVFNYRGHTLDGYSAPRLERLLGRPVSVVDSLQSLVSLL
jgi:putative radical SAM enzyme (TIGR03279 family)